MWISRKLSETTYDTEAEKGIVAINSNGSLDAGSSSNSRGIECFTPYGYSTLLPAGTEVILVPSSDGSAALGAKADTADLSAGEVRISSKGGASILLRNDGCVVINGGLIINKEGEIINEL